MIIKAFEKTYADFKLSLPDISLEKGKVYAVIGANGCGKSTFAKCLCGIIEPDSGKVLVDGLNGKIGCMSQSSFPFRMSVRNNVLLNTDNESLADEIMHRLSISELASKNAKKLSGGQTARMALARALAGSYELLILDEPCASMDMQSCLASEQCISEYAKKGAAVVLITHSLQQAGRISDYVLYIEDGRLIESGESRELLNNPKDARTRAFLDFYGI